MKRDMDLARSILLELEEHPHVSTWKSDLTVEGHSPDEVSYHVKILSQAGLIEATTMANPPHDSIWIPISLTWDGHEFLDAAKDDTRWNKAKSLVKEKGGGAAFEVMKAVLIELAKAAALVSIKGS